MIPIQNKFDFIKTLSADRFCKFLQVLLGQTKNKILARKQFSYRSLHKSFLRKTIIKGKVLL